MDPMQDSYDRALGASTSSRRPPYRGSATAFFALAAIALVAFAGTIPANPALPVCCPARIVQDPPPKAPREPYFFTSFGREFIAPATAILVADITASERIGVTTCTFVRMKPVQWLHGPGKKKPEIAEDELAVLGKLATSPPKGSRQLVFLRRDGSTSQLEISAADPIYGGRADLKQAVIEAYLRIALLEPDQRFAEFLKFQEEAMATKGWPRWHALRELAELSIAEPARFRPEDIARWRYLCEGDADTTKTIDRLEREWRRKRRGS